MQVGCRKAGDSLTRDERPDRVGSHVEREDGKGIGIQCGYDGNRKIHLKNDGEQGAKKELDGIAAGDQAGEQSRCHPARYRSAMQMPQVVVLQPVAKERDKAVLPDGFMGRQVFSEKFARGHEISVRKKWR